MVIWNGLLSFSFQALLLIFVCFPFDGCLRWWGRFRWPWGKFIFYSALSSIGSISLTLRHQFFVLSSFRWSRFCWPRGTNFIFAVRFLRWGRFRWPWGTNLISVLIFGEADFVDLEVPVYFLQCAFFNGVDFADPEARFWPFWVPSFGWSRSCWLWGANLFLAVDCSLTSRLWACWK